eukprot:TRINITY_DN5683_c4_g1_i1.p1 TRINITY_DN5683_c4_g1~~TRINITY_DN5683_c4_g1_i1.p1  ORF type:complete len:221 (+),score=30.90 TRINITY_DN5683_c4_g1_i1:43-663(+)
MVIYSGKVHRWMPERGYGFIKCTTLPNDVLVHFSSLKGGGNLIVGHDIDFELATCRTLKVKRIVGEKGINRIWIDVNGKQVDWNGRGFVRELARIRNVEAAVPKHRLERSFLDTEYLTDPADDNVAFNRMINGKRAVECKIRATHPKGVVLDPDTLEILEMPDEKKTKKSGRGPVGRSRSRSRGRASDRKHPRDRQPQTHKSTRPR